VYILKARKKEAKRVYPRRRQKTEGLTTSCVWEHTGRADYAYTAYGSIRVEQAMHISHTAAYGR
jgi:hypothetical protein